MKLKAIGPAIANSEKTLATWFRDQIPSLESFQTRTLDDDTWEAWLKLLLSKPTECGKIGPKESFSNPAFVDKVNQVLGHQSLDSIVDACAKDEWASFIAESSVVALPPGALSYDHFVQNYVSDDTTKTDLENQRNVYLLRARDLGIPSKSIAGIFYVDPEPIHETKLFQLIVHTHVR